MTINWTTVNVPTILAVVGAAWGLFTYINGFDTRIQRMEEYRVTRSAQTDKEFDRVKNSIAQVQAVLDGVPFRVGVLEKGLEEAGRRTDRLSEIVLQNMEGIRKDLNHLGTEVKVLSSKFDDQFPRQKTRLERMDVPQHN